MLARSTLITLCLLSTACGTTRVSRTSTEGEAVNASASMPAVNWTCNATIIEACSCPMFCQCYFNDKPASHPGCCPPGADVKDAPRYCRFNNAYKVNKGMYGDVSLDGVKWWITGDLGGDFSDGEMDWAICHFDPSVKKEQREGIQAVLGALYPVRWGSFTIGEDKPIEWTANRERAVAKLDGGKAGEVVLQKNKGMTDEPIVMHNLRYWGAPRNDGFVMMQNEVEAYRLGKQPFEYERTNGFMITFDITSKEAPAGGPAKGY
jgi:hypothetical protein